MRLIKYVDDNKNHLEQLVQEYRNLFPIDVVMRKISMDMQYNSLSVKERIEISTCVMNLLTHEERVQLAKIFLYEQIIVQRQSLATWGFVTGQAMQIDSGYIAQHLVSLIAKVPGQSMRGKGIDLMDGSEVKSANFLDSLDQKNSSNPRWNFPCNNMQDVLKFKDNENIYLVSIDLNTHGFFRIRIWKTSFKYHPVLNKRYDEWITKLAIPKFNNKIKRQSVNFQLFPPASKTEDTFARHGNNRDFEKICIPLENTPYSQLIFRADEMPSNEIAISVC